MYYISTYFTAFPCANVAIVWTASKPTTYRNFLKFKAENTLWQNRSAPVWSREVAEVAICANRAQVISLQITNICFNPILCRCIKLLAIKRAAFLWPLMNRWTFYKSSRRGKFYGIIMNLTVRDTQLIWRAVIIWVGLCRLLSSHGLYVRVACILQFLLALYSLNCERKVGGLELHNYPFTYLAMLIIK